MSVLLAGIYVYHVSAWYLWMPEKDVRPLETGFAYGCDCCGGSGN